MSPTMDQMREAQRALETPLFSGLPGDIEVSFEFFPPKTQEGIPALFKAIDRLKQFQPSYVSVTCGAGGSTRDLTEEISLGIKRQAGLEVMTHVTCSGQSKDDVIDVLGRLEQEKIDNVIGLRGDPPRGQADYIAAEGGFAHATDLIEHMKSNFGFGIAAFLVFRPG